MSRSKAHVCLEHPLCATILIGIGKQHTGDRYIGNPAINYRTEKKSKILVTDTRRVLEIL